MNKSTLKAGILISAASAAVGFAAKYVLDAFKELKRYNTGHLSKSLDIEPDGDSAEDEDVVEKYCMFAPTEDRPASEDPPAMSAYLSGYGDGYNEGFEAGRSKGYDEGFDDGTSSRKPVDNDQLQTAPTADDDAIPLDPDDDSFMLPEDDDSDESEEAGEWPCLEKLKDVPLNKGKKVTELIMSCIPFGEDPDTTSAPLVEAVLKATFNAVKKPRTFASAFSMIRSLRDGTASISDLPQLSSKPEKIEAMIKPFLEADPEDQQQALVDICNVLSAINADKVIELAQPRPTKTES